MAFLLFLSTNTYSVRLQDIGVQRREETGSVLPGSQQVFLGQSGPLLFTDGWPNVTRQHRDSSGSPPDEWPSAILLKGIYYKITIFAFLRGKEKKKTLSFQFSTPNNKRFKSMCLQANLFTRLPVTSFQISKPKLVLRIVVSERAPVTNLLAIIWGSQSCLNHWGWQEGLVICQQHLPLQGQEDWFLEVKRNHGQKSRWVQNDFQVLTLL